MCCALKEMLGPHRAAMPTMRVAPRLVEVTKNIFRQNDLAVFRQNDLAMRALRERLLQPPKVAMLCRRFVP